MRRKSGPRESTIVNHEEGELKKNHPLLEARHAWVRRGIKLHLIEIEKALGSGIFNKITRR